LNVESKNFEVEVEVWLDYVVGCSWFVSVFVDRSCSSFI